MDIGEKLSVILSGILIVAIVAVIVSKGSATSALIKSATGTLTRIVGVIVAPVTGSGSNGQG